MFHSIILLFIFCLIVSFNFHLWVSFFHSRYTCHRIKSLYLSFMNIYFLNKFTTHLLFTCVPGHTVHLSVIMHKTRIPCLFNILSLVLLTLFYCLMCWMIQLIFLQSCIYLWFGASLFISFNGLVEWFFRFCCFKFVF